MSRIYIAAILGIAGALGACGGDSSGPGGGGGGATFTIGDPVGDTFGVDSVQWDIDTFSIARDTGGITVKLTFTTNVISPIVDTLNAVFAFIDLDVDQDSVSGLQSDADFVRPDAGSSGIGAEFEIDLANFNASDSTFPVVDTTFFQSGSVRATYSGKTITVRVPRGVLRGDDGFLDAVADAYTYNEPTDIVPNSGHLRVATTGQAPPALGAATAGRRGSFHRTWAARRQAFLKRR